jgi:hypothetical protein
MSTEPNKKTHEDPHQKTHEDPHQSSHERNQDVEDISKRRPTHESNVDEERGEDQDREPQRRQA